jgi:phage terminase large subunit GpA-like protein
MKARSAIRPRPTGAKRPPGERRNLVPGLSPRAGALLGRLRRSYKPAPIMTLSQWTEAEGNLFLPEGQSARAGTRWRNWPYMREILDSIGDPECERVTIIKGTRLGYTKALMAAIGATAATDPCPMILLVPTDDDARGYAVDEMEPLFEASPALQNILVKGRNDGRNKLTRKQLMGGGSIKILAARSPRNLRRHDAKKLFCDEVDAMEITAEGDPLYLAEKRTFAHADRKIVVGSTPTEEDFSIIDKRYNESDKRIFEVPCPHCGVFFEILWGHIRWPEGRPTEAVCICPHCEDAHSHGGPPPKPILDRQKGEMAENGVWRVTKPEILGHRGYKINALVSTLANAAWPKLADEFLKSKRAGPSELQVFANTVEARVWQTSIGRVDASGLAARVEPWGLTDNEGNREMGLPPWVQAITAGVDTQDERLEVTLVGWSLYGPPCVLAHLVLEGSTLEKTTWDSLDRLLRQRWQHPAGWWLGIDAAAIDSGGSEGRTQQVYDFCDPKAFRRVFAIKGDGGARPIWKKAKKPKGGSRLAIVGVDQLKTEILERLARHPFDEAGQVDSSSLRLSEDLPEDYFDQVTGEVRRTRYIRNRVVREFQPKSRSQRVEALDCTVYAFAVRHSPAFRMVNMAERAARAAAVPVATETPAAATMSAPGATEAPVRPAPPATVAKPAAAAPATGRKDWGALFNGPGKG